MREGFGADSREASITCAIPRSPTAFPWTDEIEPGGGRSRHGDRPYGRGPGGASGSLAAAVCGLLVFCSCPSASAAEPLPRSVLVVDQFEVASAGSVAVLAALRSRLRSDPAPISIYIENMDLGRFGGDRFTDAVEAYFVEKYREKPIGVLVAVGSAALELVLQVRARRWPEVPVVFTAVDEGAPGLLALPAGVTGTTMRALLSENASVAQALIPGLKRIAIVGDPPNRQFIRRNVLAQLENLATQFDVIDLTGLSMPQLKERVGSLPDDSIIAYIGLTIDARGVAYTSREALSELAGVANRPIFVQAETQLGTGAVGGVLVHLASMGDAAARLALRVLTGEPVASIPAAAGNMTQPVFDWRQLQRWNISENRLPPGSDIRFRSLTAWERYRWQIVTALLALVLQAALICGLLYERWKRFRSERAAHELSGHLIHAQEDERARLARELHDDVTQRLALLAIEAGTAERKMPVPVNGSMRSMREGLIRLSDDVHALSYRLHPAVLEDLGLVEALKSECERFSRTCPTELKLDIPDLPQKPRREVALCLFRIVQESLRNVARHAAAASAQVSLRQDGDRLQLTVRDDGLGFDPEARRGRVSLGLASMRQRAFLLGGTVKVESRIGRGTAILATIPFKEQFSEPSTRALG
jgi:signal transduction histidine kinase